MYNHPRGPSSSWSKRARSKTPPPLLGKACVQRKLCQMTAGVLEPSPSLDHGTGHTSLDLLSSAERALVEQLRQEVASIVNVSVHTVNTGVSFLPGGRWQVAGVHARGKNALSLDVRLS